TLSGIWGVANGMTYYKATTAQQTDSCWRTANSSNIVIGTSVALNNDVISSQPVTVIPQDDEKISVRSSILVRQYAITHYPYQFRSNLQKNTELRGSLFDPQPFQPNSNIHSETDAGEPVIGFVSASSVQESRIFIQHDQVNNWNYSTPNRGCDNFPAGGQD